MDANKWLQGDDRRFAKGVLCLFLTLTAGAVAALIGTDLSPGALFGVAGFGFVGALATIFALDLERTDFAARNVTDAPATDKAAAQRPRYPDGFTTHLQWTERERGRRWSEDTNPAIFGTAAWNANQALNSGRRNDR